MPFASTNYIVMIACPSDATPAKDAILELISEWNANNSVNRKVTLSSWFWKQNSVPLVGGHPQKIINSQGVDQADMLIGVFQSRLGYPTLKEASGTVEEIKRAANQSKPVHMYFSAGGHASDVNTGELERLREFKKEIGASALISDYIDLGDLKTQVLRAIEHNVAQWLTVIASSASSALPVSSPIHWSVEYKNEKTPKSTDNKGKIKYETRHWLEVRNLSTISDALDVEFVLINNGPGIDLVNRKSPTVIHAGQQRELPLMVFFAEKGDPELKITWQEDGQIKEEAYHF